tara:strand:- start:42 stop:332 length:291 start_codon:yes stop_codon:yes gene_type:complete
MARSHGYYIRTNTVMKQWRRIKMNNQIRMVLMKRYEAEIEDAKYKIKCYSDQELVIPEHPDITGEVDKLLAKISSAEDKMAVMELHYGKIKAKDIL